MLFNSKELFHTFFFFKPFQCSQHFISLVCKICRLIAMKGESKIKSSLLTVTTTTA